jgi:hypothetical protein
MPVDFRSTSQWRPAGVVELSRSDDYRTDEPDFDEEEKLFNDSDES